MHTKCVVVAAYRMFVTIWNSQATGVAKICCTQKKEEDEVKEKKKTKV